MKSEWLLISRCGFCGVFLASFLGFVDSPRAEVKTNRVLEIEGIGEGVFSTGKGSATRKIKFIVRTDGGRWRIRILGADDNFSFYESGSLGSTNRVFTLASYDPKFIEKEATSDPSVNTAIRSLCWIEAGPVPVFQDSCPYIGVLWYAFCSSHYLDSLADSSRLIPPYQVDNVDNYSALGLTNVLARTTRSRAWPNYPETIHFVHTGRRWSVKGAFDAPPPFHHGFTNAAFLAEEFSEIGGFSVPNRIRFVVEEPIHLRANGAVKVEMAPMRRIQLQITGVRILQSAIEGFIPSMAGRSLSSDSRFVSQQRPLFNLSYESDRWLSDEEVENSLAFKNAETKLRMLSGAFPKNFHADGILPGRTGPRTRTSRTVLWTLIVFSICFPILLGLMGKRRNRPNQTNE